MDQNEKNNVKLFNLVDKGVSSRTVLRVFNAHKKENVTADIISLELGETPTSQRFISEFMLMDTSYYSAYCLLPFGINMLVIDKLHAKYNSLEEMSKDSSLKLEFNLQEKTIGKIENALNELGINQCDNLHSEILCEIEKRARISNSELKVLVLNRHPNISVQRFDQEINKMLSDSVVVQTIDGLQIKRQTISEYFESVVNGKQKCILQKLAGKSLQEIADQFGVTKSRVGQIIQKEINKFPIFYDEERYSKVISNYNLTDGELCEFGYQDKTLVNYVKYKYKPSPSKSIVQFILDRGLTSSSAGNKVLQSKRLVQIDGELIADDFITLLKEYTKRKKLHLFSLEEIRDDFNSFLSFYHVNNKENYIGQISEMPGQQRKLERSSAFIPVIGQKFMVYKPNEFSYELCEELHSFLSEFQGYASMEKFYTEHNELCVRNCILNENEAYAVAKALYGKEFHESIEFVRNPVILSRGVNKERYIEDLLLDMDLPCSVSDFLAYVHETTGLKPASVYSNFGKLLHQFQNSQGLLSLNDDVSLEQNQYLSKLLDGIECVGTKYLNDMVELKYGTKTQAILSTSNLWKIGYCKTNTSVFKKQYSNRLTAVLAEIDIIEDFIVNEAQLEKIANLEYYYYRNHDFIDTCALIRLPNHQYLNLRKRHQTELLMDIKKTFLKVLDENEIYVLHNFEETKEFKRIQEENNRFNELLLAFDTTEIIRSIILSIRQFYYLENAQELVFSKKELSFKTLVESILNEYQAMSIVDLQELLYEKYGFSKVINNTGLSDMGYYCPNSSQRVYLTKQHYDLEMEETLKWNV